MIPSLILWRILNIGSSTDWGLMCLGHKPRESLLATRPKTNINMLGANFQENQIKSTPDPDIFLSWYFAKVCPPLGRRKYIHHQYVSRCGSHLYRDMFAEVLGSGVVGTLPKRHLSFEGAKDPIGNKLSTVSKLFWENWFNDHSFSSVATSPASYRSVSGPSGPRCPRECPWECPECPKSVPRVSRECQKGVPDTLGTLLWHSGAWGPKGPRDTFWDTPSNTPCFREHSLGHSPGHFGPEGPERLL